jgi:phosphate transport system substrate-binding protein
MSAKNETTVLVLALLVTAGVVGAGIWWFSQKSGFNFKTTAPETAKTAETFAQVSGVPNGIFTYGGSTTWATVRKEIDPAIQTVWPNFKLRYADSPTGAPSTDTGIRMLLNNQLEFAQASRPITDQEYQQAQQRGFKIKEIPVALDAIAIVVHPNLKVAGITTNQFTDIYSGKITNWQQVGGPNLKIKLYGKPVRDSNTSAELINTTTEALQKIQANPGAIFYTSAPLVVGQCNVKTLPLGRTVNELIPPYQEPFIPLSQCPQKRNQVNTEAILSGKYPNTRRLTVIVKQNGQIDEQAGEAYAKLLLTAQGKELLSKAGFVPIR